MTRPNILKIKSITPETDIILTAADILDHDGVLVVPTETRYGLAVRADRQSSFEKVYDIKGRSEKTPSAIFIKDTECISDYAVETDISRRLAAKFLPGPLTLVLDARPGLDNPAVYKGRVGLRISSSKVIEALLDTVAFGLTATSANKSGTGNLETVEQIAAVFGDAVDLYLDAGRLDGPVSTVVDASGDRARILREGAIGQGEIANEVTV